MTSFATSGPVWYLMRATGVVTLVLLTGVFVLGIATTTRWRARRLPGFAVSNNQRAIVVLCFCVAALGGLGLDGLMRSEALAPIKVHARSVLGLRFGTWRRRGGRLARVVAGRPC